jgi:hypothetical protein
MAVLHVYGETVRCEVLVALNMKVTVFWNMAPYAVVRFDPEGGMNRFFRKVDKFLSVYLVSHPRRQE